MYDNAKLLLVNGGIDFDTDTLKVSLHTSSYTPALTHDEFSDIGGQLSTANGYTSGGLTVTGSVSKSGSTTTLNLTADPSWTASGGSLVARYAVLRKVGTVSGLVDPPIGYILMNTTPGDITATDGSPLTIVRHASGLWTITGATS
jgi:hypothetical protein